MAISNQVREGSLSGTENRNGGVFMSHNRICRGRTSSKLKRWFMSGRILLIAGSMVLLQGLVCSLCVAGESGRYAVFAGIGEDNAYLVDTATGFVWYLTHRTMAIGREPIAIPYKFIQMPPKNQQGFLVEKVPHKGNPKESEDVK